MCHRSCFTQKYPLVIFAPVEQIFIPTPNKYYELCGLRREITKLTSKTATVSERRAHNSDTQEGTTGVAECKDYNPSHQLLPMVTSTIVVDFLILGALALLRLLRWGLQVQWLRVVMGEGLRVERVHKALRVSKGTCQTLCITTEHPQSNSALLENMKAGHDRWSRWRMWQQVKETNAKTGTMESKTN